MGCLKLSYSQTEWPLFVSANDFNDGEKDRGNWYDLPYRNYDPTLGRFVQIDPLAQQYASLSPYHYSYNNPVMFNDPSGAGPGDGSPNDPYGNGFNAFGFKFFGDGRENAPTSSAS